MLRISWDRIDHWGLRQHLDAEELKALVLRNRIEAALDAELPF